ncbi:radical SAM family heme chaperone HemW [Aliikangiella maris]|uniref:Radical SAM family heme chaperone HemW n=2 Tax=Aliikangiella maris TaxID=3162458 RepID=A0ABV2BYZ0_9GAMM
MTIKELPPLSLYIHVPWCVQKCPYCDFNSHQLKEQIPEKQYIDRLIQDLEEELPNIWGRSLVSIFIGGGTPSLLSPESFDYLLSKIRALIPFYSDMEITMEANPGTVEADKFKGFFEAGINRISLGVQSFQDNFLHALGRIHSANEAIKAFEIARNAGFNNINIDLMFGLPKQSIEQAMFDLQQAIRLKPEHLSWYQLTLEPNTLFYHQPPSLPDDEVICDIYEQGVEWLAQNCYQQYEVSAYSYQGKLPAVHNLNYWHFGDYVGIGAGAHGKVTRADDQTITRKSKRRNPKDYLNLSKSLIDNRRVIPQEELPLEFMMNTLRLKSGFPLKLFFETTGILPTYIAQPLAEAQEQELIIIKDNHITPTEQGFRFLNELLAIFMPENFNSIDNKSKQPTIKIKKLD